MKIFYYCVTDPYEGPVFSVNLYFLQKGCRTVKKFFFWSSLISGFSCKKNSQDLMKMKLSIRSEKYKNKKQRQPNLNPFYVCFK